MENSHKSNCPRALQTTVTIIYPSAYQGHIPLHTMYPLSRVYNRVRSAYSNLHYYVAGGQSASNTDDDEQSPSDSKGSEGDDGNDKVGLDCDHLAECIRLLDHLTGEERELEETRLSNLLQHSQIAEKIFISSDSNGYTLLQHACYVGSLRLAEALLAGGALLDTATTNGAQKTNGGQQGTLCSLPLHLACQGGHVELCCLLLNSGARTDVSTAMCYPEPHQTGSSTCRRFGLPLTGFLMGVAGHGSDRTIMCSGEALYPVEYLLSVDADHVLDVFLQPQYQSWVDHIPLQHLFSEACRNGAERCIRLCLDRFHSVGMSNNTPPSGSVFTTFVARETTLSLDQLDEFGYSPFLYVVASCCLDLVSLFISLGADPRQESSSGESGLHVLFKSLTRLDDITERVQLLLANGLETVIGRQDSSGLTVLHSLVNHVNNNYRYLSAVNSLSTSPGGVQLTGLPPADPDTQASYQRQILECLGLLLEHNAPVQCRDSYGQTALGLLLSTYSSFLSNDVDPNFASPLTYLYIFNMEVLAEALNLFYSNGCSPMEPDTPPGVPVQLPLKRLLHGILNISPVQYHLFRFGYLECLRVTLSHRAECNFRLQNEQGTCISLVAALAESVLNTVGVAGFEYDRAAKEANCIFIDDILRLLLKYGLDPNYRCKRTRPFLQGGRGNALCDFVHLSRVITDLSDLRFVHTWIVTLLQWGADPQLEPYPAEPTILHSQSSIFLRHQRTYPFNQLLHYSRESAGRLATSIAGRRLLMLLAIASGPLVVVKCLQEMAAKLEREDRTSPILGLVSEMLAQMEPCSLKQLARLVVMRSMMRRLHPTTVAGLCLPVELERYLLQIEV